MIPTFELLRKKPGIYIAIHRASGIAYVGSSVNPWNRRSSHISAANKGSRSHFHRALREFGPTAFDFDIIEWCPKEKLLERERFWIVFFNAASLDGFNTRTNPVATYDVSPSEVTRERISKAGEGRVFSEEHKRRISEGATGHVSSPERRAKIAASLRGKRPSDETRKKMSIFQTGRKHSEETMKKLREAPHHKDPAHLERLRQGWVNMPAENKANVLASIAKTNAARKGVPRTPEVRKKMSDARRAGIARRRLEAETRNAPPG